MRSDNSNGSRAAPARGFMALFAALIMAAVGSASAAPTETVLYAFTGGGSDGGIPLAALIADSSGNLYGTTSVAARRGAAGTGAAWCSSSRRAGPRRCCTPSRAAATGVSPQPA